MRRPLLVGLAAVAVLVVAGMVAGYAYFFSSLRTAPQPLSLSSPSATASAKPSASPSAAGRWTVSSGSQAGYRVKEQFVGQTSPHEAVARTSAVTGEVTVQPSSGGLTASGLKFTVDLTQLQSVDQVAGYNATNRDRAVNQALATQQFPQAVFQAQSVALPDGFLRGQQVNLTVPGQLTIHGVTKDVTATMQLQMSGGSVQAAGSVPINMTNFGVTPPQVSITKAEAEVTVEFQLVLARA
jgi:polyisoprenoid-binding protein YceI